MTNNPHVPAASLTEKPAETENPVAAWHGAQRESHLTAEYERNSRGVNIRVVARALPGEDDNQTLQRLDAAITVMHARYVDADDQKK